MAASGYREVHRPTSVSASYHGAFERLERLDGKLSRAVPGGRGGGNAALLPDQIKFTQSDFPPRILFLIFSLAFPSQENMLQLR
jgi:hypothetical protein